MTDLISRAMFNNEILVERKLKSCYINCEEGKGMNNFDVLQEYEKAGVPLPRLEEVEQIKELLKECQSVFEEIKKDRGVYFNNIHLTELIDEIDGVLK